MTLPKERAGKKKGKRQSPKCVRKVIQKNKYAICIVKALKHKQKNDYVSDQKYLTNKKKDVIIKIMTVNMCK